QVIGLVNETNENVCNYLRGSRVDICLIYFVRHVLFSPEPTHEQRFAAVLGPEAQFPRSQQILVILEELFETRASDTRQLNLGFFRTARYIAAFHNVLFPRTRSLNHLIERPVALFQKAFAKTDRCLENDQCLLIRCESCVASMRRNKPFARRHTSHL